MSGTDFLMILTKEGDIIVSIQSGAALLHTKDGTTKYEAGSHTVLAHQCNLNSLIKIIANKKPMVKIFYHCKKE